MTAQRAARAALQQPMPAAQRRETPRARRSDGSGPALAPPHRLSDVPAQLEAAAPNRTGMPDALKLGLEALSGFDLSGVRVHRGSPKPAALQAEAYARGDEIHLAPNREHHLPHEAWHIVQQRQGRVRATTNVGGTPVNDDHALEREADVMGSRALQHGAAQLAAIGEPPQPRTVARGPRPSSAAAQRVVEQVKSGNTTYFRTTLDPRRYFGSKPDATKHENDILDGKAEAKPDAKSRAPTMHTLFHTKPGCVLGSNVQGPHTVSACVVDGALNGMNEEELDDQYGALPSPKDLKATIVEESKAMTGNVDDKIDRAVEYHAGLRSAYERVQSNKKHPHGLKLRRHLLRRLMHAEPHATYLWNADAPTKDPMWKTYIATKGERPNAPWKKSVDPHARSHFKNQKRFDGFVKRRRAMVSAARAKQEKAKKGT